MFSLFESTFALQSVMRTSVSNFCPDFVKIVVVISHIYLMKFLKTRFKLIKWRAGWLNGFRSCIRS